MFAILVASSVALLVAFLLFRLWLGLSVLASVAMALSLMSVLPSLPVFFFVSVVVFSLIFSYVVLMAVVLNLFSPAVWQSLVSSAVAASAAPADARVVNGVRRDSVVCRWCIGCPLDGLCDSDQCGARRQSLYDYSERLAKHDPNSQWISRFPDLGVYINFLKKHGLL